MMTTMTTTMRLAADFNEVFDTDYVRVVLPPAAMSDHPLNHGSGVQLVDEDGESCWAEIVKVRPDSPVLVCRLLWETWQPTVTVELPVPFESQLLVRMGDLAAHVKPVAAEGP